jgi:hypothetical protein
VEQVITCLVGKIRNQLIIQQFVFIFVRYISVVTLGKKKIKAVSTVTGLEWHRGFQEVKGPRFHDNGTGWW